MEISKLEASKRQINIAIFLYFHEMDLVSAHTLTGAARNILFDFFKFKGMKFKPISVIKKLRRKNYENWLRGAQNFFKHASKEDEIRLFDLKEEMTENLIFDAISRYKDLAEPSAHMQMFLGYFLLKNFDDIVDGEIQEQAKTLV